MVTRMQTVNVNQGKAIIKSQTRSFMRRAFSFGLPQSFVLRHLSKNHPQLREQYCCVVNDWLVKLLKISKGFYGRILFVNSESQSIQFTGFLTAFKVYSLAIIQCDIRDNLI